MHMNKTPLGIVDFCSYEESVPALMGIAWCGANPSGKTDNLYSRASVHPEMRYFVQDQGMREN